MKDTTDLEADIAAGQHGLVERFANDCPNTRADGSLISVKPTYRPTGPPDRPTGPRLVDQSGEKIFRRRGRNKLAGGEGRVPDWS